MGIVSELLVLARACGEGREGLSREDLQNYIAIGRDVEETMTLDELRLLAFLRCCAPGRLSAYLRCVEAEAHAEHKMRLLRNQNEPERLTYKLRRVVGDQGKQI